MFIYIKSEPQLWTVGFYDPAEKFVPESDWPSDAAAAERVHWLNGGALPGAPRRRARRQPPSGKP
jgi:hypothetical protein